MTARSVSSTFSIFPHLDQELMPEQAAAQLTLAS
jgi:hypothetical protein